jgi:hypothetical protein
VTQVGSAPLVTATQAETGGGYGSAAPVHAEPAPTMTSYSAYQGAGMETWQAPAGYNSSSQPPAQSGYAGDARFSVSQQPAFSLQSNQGYMPQNKYASGHGVYGYASSMYPGSQSFGPVGYGQDAYNAQAQQGHLQSQMMSTSFGGVGYDYSFGRQAQGYPQAAVTYRQDGGLLPTASLQSFNARTCRLCCYVVALGRWLRIRCRGRSVSSRLPARRWQVPAACIRFRTCWSHARHARNRRRCLLQQCIHAGHGWCYGSGHIPRHARQHVVAEHSRLAAVRIAGHAGDAP